jgi:hypothetical protein
MYLLAGFMWLRERDDCHGITENVMFGQMAPMGTGAFDVALDMDMLKDVIVDHRLPMQSVLSAQVDAGMTPGQVAMTPYDSNSPMWNQESYKGRLLHSPCLHRTEAKSQQTFPTVALDKSPSRWCDVTRSSWLQPEFTDRVLADIALRSPVTIHWCDVAIQHFPIRHVTIL